ncbi:MAG: hypothetical protein JO282_07745 [Alphaproteobacteria bacterium]|nr:hypothetical protein [Alphaproteobacteria bacterium]
MGKLTSGICLVQRTLGEVALLSAHQAGCDVTLVGRRRTIGAGDISLRWEAETAHFALACRLGLRPAGAMLASCPAGLSSDVNEIKLAFSIPPGRPTLDLFGEVQKAAGHRDPSTTKLHDRGL